MLYTVRKSGELIHLRSCTPSGRRRTTPTCRKPGAPAGYRYWISGILDANYYTRGGSAVHRHGAHQLYAKSKCLMVCGIRDARSYYVCLVGRHCADYGLPIAPGCFLCCRRVQHHRRHAAMRLRLAMSRATSTAEYFYRWLLVRPRQAYDQCLTCSAGARAAYDLRKPTTTEEFAAHEAQALPRAMMR